MENQIQKLIEAIKADYAKSARKWKVKDEEQAKWRDQREQVFNEGLGYKVGKKYIKITEQGENDPKFKKGDILKPAGWATPARNQARGNVIEGNFDWVQWTGPAYLN